MGFFSSSTKYNLPSWVSGPTAGVSAAAMPLITKKYQSYGGDLTAGLNGTQTDAMGMLKNLLNKPRAPNIRSIDNVPGAGGAQGTTQDYMNPYLSNVLDPTLREIKRSTTQNEMTNDAQANMAGAFGDTGHALKQAETARLGTEAVGDATSKAYYDAFNSAMGAKQTDIGRSTADDYNTRNQQANIIGQMFGQGNQQQETEQAGDSAKFQEFLRKQGFDETQLAKIAAIVGSLPTGTATTSPSTASSILSGIGSIFAL